MHLLHDTPCVGGRSRALNPDSAVSADAMKQNIRNEVDGPYLRRVQFVQKVQIVQDVWIRLKRLVRQTTDQPQIVWLKRFEPTVVSGFAPRSKPRRFNCGIPVENVLTIGRRTA
jgi:hypothetical protein